MKNEQTVKCDGCEAQCDWLMRFGDEYLCQQCLNEEHRKIKELQRGIDHKNELLRRIAFVFTERLPATAPTRALYGVILDEIKRDYA